MIRNIEQGVRILRTPFIRACGQQAGYARIKAQFENAGNP